MCDRICLCGKFWSKALFNICLANIISMYMWLFNFYKDMKFNKTRYSFYSIKVRNYILQYLPRVLHSH